MGWKAKGIVAALALATLFGVAQAQVTITFRFNDPEGPQMRQALNEFEKANPDIKVTMQRVTWADAQQHSSRSGGRNGAGRRPTRLSSGPDHSEPPEQLRPLDDLIKKTDVGVAGWDQFVSRDPPAPTAKPMRSPVHHRHVCGRLQQGSAQGRRIYKLPTSWADLRAASKAVHEERAKLVGVSPAGSCGTPTIWF